MPPLDELVDLIPAIDRVFLEALDSLDYTISCCIGEEETAEWQKKYDDAQETWEKFHAWIEFNLKAQEEI